MRRGVAGDDHDSEGVMNCELSPTGRAESGRYEFTCLACGLPYWSKRQEPWKIRRPCGHHAGTFPPPPLKPPLPSLRKRLANFTVAAIKHVIAGAPTCDDETIAARLAVCRTCEKFRPDENNPEIGACALCGCPASDLLPRFISKLAWADQTCPLDKW